MSRLPRPRLAILAATTLGSALLIGVVDYLTGLEFSFFVFYFIPVGIASWGMGRRAGVVTALGCAAIWLAVDFASGHAYGWWLNRYLDTGIRLAAFLVLAGAIAAVRESLLRERALTAQLQEALENVHQLSGLIPICASCKSIRNDDGYWERIETYIRQRSAAQFSHGICPECEKKLYPEELLNRLYPRYGAEGPQADDGAQAAPLPWQAGP
jgi:hypothetical protein